MKNNLKIIFFGTSQFAYIVLERLKENGFTPTLIVTTPDKPKGRKLIVTPPETKVWAEENDIDVLQPETLKDEEFIDDIKNTDWDLFIVASYGKIIPKEVLDLPKHKVLNVHPSLLPKFRGASPIQSSLISDEEKTGVTIMQIDKRLDHGPIVAQATMEIENWPIRADLLEEMLATEGGNLLSEVIPEWIKGEITPEEQDHDEASYTKKIEKDDGLINLNDDPKLNYRKFCAYVGWPRTFFFTEENKRIVISDASFEDGKFVINKIIPEGKKEMKYSDFINK